MGFCVCRPIWRANIQKGKMPWGLTGLTMSEDQVAIWMEFYPVCAHVTLARKSMYSADDETKEEKRKEEGEKRRVLDTDDRNSCLRRVEEAFPSSEMTSSSLYNTINGKVVNASVNVQETVQIGESMFLDSTSSLPGGFHAPLKRKVKTMESIKCGVAIGDKTFYDMASLSCVLITVGQHRQAELQTLFDYELCAVPASIIDECGCLRTGTKSTLFSKLKVDEGRRSCWSSCNAWSWHTLCTTDQLPAVSNDVNSRPSLLVCCLQEHYLVVCSSDVTCQISVYRWKRFDTYSCPSCPFGVEGIRGQSHAFTCSNTIERANKFASSLWQLLMVSTLFTEYSVEARVVGGLQYLTPLHCHDQIG